jgi:hypothetical protein
MLGECLIQEGIRERSISFKDENMTTKYLPIAVLACASLLTGCAVDKYQAAAPAFTGTAGARENGGVVVLLEPVFPGKPFSEIVCDNDVGVSWSPEESQHIGFTQRYARTLAKNGPQIAMLATLPTNQRIGMTASGDIAPLNIDSRMLVPFGRFISNNLKQALGADGQVCEDEECVRGAMQQRPKARVVSVHFTKFRVAEQQRNMLMLEVEGVATARRADATATTVPIHNMVNRSITSEGLWHSDFLKAMNIIANESSSAVASQIRAAGL